MGANIPSWTEEALGRRLTPEEFLKDREAQEKTFEHHFGKAARQHGNPYDAASVWFSGRPMSRAGNASDILGTTVPAYVSKFRASYEGNAPRPPGLVPEGSVPEKRVAGVETVKGSEGPSFLDNLSEKATSSSFLVPALSFVGGMLSSKSPYLAGAVGEGIVSGVSGYQSERGQQIQIAKNIFDIVKDRFSVTYDPKTKQNKFFNKNTGEFVTPGQVQGATYDMLKSAGLNPTTWGVSKPGAVQTAAIGAIPAIGAETGAKTAPGETPAAGQAAVPGEQKKPGAPETKTDLAPTQMTVSQLKQDVRENGDKYGLTGERDPKVWQQSIEEKREAAMAIGNLPGRSAEAAQMRASADEEQKRLDKALDDAVSLQAKENEELLKAKTEGVKGYRNGIMKRLEIYDKERAELKRLADIYSAFQTGRLEEFKAQLDSMMKGVGMEKFIPNVIRGDAAAFDAAMKTALKRAFEAVDANNMARAPKAALQEGILTVPGPTLDPGAVYEMIGRSLGEMDYEFAKDQAYLERPYGADPVKFLSEQASKKGEVLQQKYRDAFGSIPIPKNADPNFVRGLERSFGFSAKGSQPAGETASAPAAPAPVRASTEQEFNALPSGTVFIGPDGVTRRKP